MCSGDVRASHVPLNSHACTVGAGTSRTLDAGGPAVSEIGGAAGSSLQLQSATASNAGGKSSNADCAGGTAAAPGMLLDVRSLRVKGAVVYRGKGQHTDDRGVFEEIDVFTGIGQEAEVRQCSYASSQQNVLRGLHCSPYGKIVACVAGEMWDVVVDLRPASATYLQWDFVRLSPKARTRLYVPPNVGHGYLSMEDGTVTLYMKLGCYDKSKEIEVSALDPEIGIRWPAPLAGAADYIMSRKDRSLPLAAQVSARTRCNNPSDSPRSRL